MRFDLLCWDSEPLLNNSGEASWKWCFDVSSEKNELQLDHHKIEDAKRNDWLSHVSSVYITTAILYTLYAGTVEIHNEIH